MAQNDPLSRTMRINIHPDYLGESLERKKRESGRVSVSETTTILAGTPPGRDHASDFRKLLQSIYDAVLIADGKGRILDFNSRALDFFLCEEPDLFGHYVIDLISGADAGLLTSIRENLKDHRYTLIDAWCIRRDKSMFPAEVAVNRIDLDEEGQLCFLVRDITVRKRAQDALEEAVTRLEAHDRARTTFVSNVSHELRTPLTSMIYAVSNMLKGVVGPVSEEIRRYLEILEGDCRRLLGTVNDILDLSRMERDRFTLARTKVVISRVVERSVEVLRVQAAQKQIDLSVERAGGPWFVDCDPQKMERVVLNIVGNSIKFTPGGGSVLVSIGEEQERTGFIRVAVRDNGIGIAKEVLPHVTERFFMAGDQPSGAGLGLAISKEIVERHGGSIEIVSPPPGSAQGTLVSIALPAVESPTILIVDDDAAVRQLIGMQLGSQGYRVSTAENGPQALERMSAGTPPDMVILDLAMPEMEGTEVVLKMKADRKLMRVPILVVTGANVNRAKAEIMNGFAIPALSKPWREADLLDCVESAFLGRAWVGR